MRGENSKGTYKTGLIHREYGAGGRSRIDISIFDPEKAAQIDQPSLKSGGKYIEPRFAIELGTEKSPDTANHISRDLAKLALATERGYLIHFFRDTSLAAAGTGRRQIKETSIEEKFRKHVRAAEILPNVCSLFFLLRIARRQKRIWSKCEIYLPESGKWEKVNLKKVSTFVLKRLS